MPMLRIRVMVWVATALLGCVEAVVAEPYIAVRAGLPCASCHTNGTGGGQRTTFGALFAQQQLAAAPSGGADAWTGALVPHLAVGGDGRASARRFDVDGQADNLAFEVDRASLYGAIDPDERITIYIDQQVAPGGSINRETWMRLNFGGAYLKAGRIFLPLGWRLEDDTALVREATGVSMTQGDDGIEIGMTRGAWNGQLAITNGAGGGGETDDGKLITARVAWVSSRGQLGFSAYSNDADTVDRAIVGAFLGWNTGPVTWLAEYDYIEDEADVDTEQQVALLEANWLVVRGHNLKVTFEGREFRETLEDQFRVSVVYEYFPWPFTQLRLGLRVRESDDPAPLLSAKEGFVQLHAYF